MTNILTKPYTDKDYADFAVLANSNVQRTEQDDIAVYALYDYEELQNGQIMDISNTDDYKAKVAENEKKAKTSQYLLQIEQIEQKIQRSLIAKTAGIATDEDNNYFNNYLNEIAVLRTKISAL